MNAAKVTSNIRFAKVQERMAVQTRDLDRRLDVCGQIYLQTSNKRIKKKAKNAISSHIASLNLIIQEVADVLNTKDYSIARIMRLQKDLRRQVMSGTARMKSMDALISDSLYVTYSEESMEEAGHLLIDMANWKLDQLQEFA